MQVEINRVLSAITQAKNTSLGVKDYTVLITYAGRVREWRKAMALLEQMKLNGLQPNLFTYTAAISACAKVGNPVLLSPTLPYYECSL